MSKYIICQSFKKIHRGIFSIAHPKYSNFGGILDAMKCVKKKNHLLFIKAYHTD